MKEKFESVKQENKRLLEIINAKPLETVDIDSAFEIEKLKEQLQAKEQECKELKKEQAEIKKYLGISYKTILERLEELTNFRDRDREELYQLKEKKEKMSKGYAELTEIVSPYIDDFTGYNEKLGGFDIVLCVKELLQQLDKLKADNEQLKEELSVIQHNCNREGCKYYDDDTFKVFYECKAQKALQLSANSVTTKYCDLLRTLAEIKEIVKYDVYTTRADLCLKLNWIKKKISECEVENAR